MNIILGLIVGGLIGWVANVIMRADTPRAVIFNLWIGVVGAVLGGWLLSLLVGTPNISDSVFNITGLLASVLGAAILLALANFHRRGLPHF